MLTLYGPVFGGPLRPRLENVAIPSDEEMVAVSPTKKETASGIEASLTILATTCTELARVPNT
jgi:hypothetical protein